MQTDKSHFEAQISPQGEVGDEVLKQSTKCNSKSSACQHLQVWMPFPEDLF